MMRQRLLAMTLVLVTLIVASGTAVFAQEATETPDAPTSMPPATFTDGRISNTAGLGGLALYCVDASGNTANVTSFDGGAITLWGVGDQKYIELTDEELRGSEEVVQEPSVLEAALTEEAPMDEPMAEMTDEPMMDATEMVDTDMADDEDMSGMPSPQNPVLLARASTPNGEIGFFSLGNDMFALQGNDDKGAFFTYTWTGCSTGTVDHTTGAFLPTSVIDPEATLEVESVLEPEATLDMEAEATESP